MEHSIRKLVPAVAFAWAAAAGNASADGPTDFRGVGPDKASVEATVASFRNALGSNNGVGPCAGACVPGVGRREVNWDAVPDSFSSGGANAFPGNFFNNATGAPAGRIRGIQFVTSGTMEVSADADSDGDGNPGPTPVLFGNHNSGNPDDFAAFSAERIFGLLGTNAMDVTFSQPGTPGTAATSRGFGVVFTDVEVEGPTSLQFFDAAGNSLHTVTALAFPFVGGDSGKSFSFAGSVFDTAIVSRVRIVNGTYDLTVSQLYGSHTSTPDAAAMDDFIYGEPLPVPEPTTWALTGLGGLLLAWRLRRRV